MVDDEMANEEMSEDEMSDETEMEDEMGDEHMATTFTVIIANTSDETDLATPLAPGALAVHTSMDTLFVEARLIAAMVSKRGQKMETPVR